MRPLIIIEDQKIIKRLCYHLKYTRRYDPTLTRTLNDLVIHLLDKSLIKREYATKFLKFRKDHARFLWERDNKSCYYCTQPVDLEHATLDHKFPVSQGGKMCDLGNIVTCCYWCNMNKGSLNHVEYQFKQLANASQGIRPPDPNLYNHKTLSTPTPSQ